MNDLSGEVRRLCIALDADKYGGRTDPDRREIERRLVEVVTDASREAGLDRLYVAERGTPARSATATVMFRREQGDGLLLLLPSGVSEARMIGGFIGEVRIALRRHNRRPGEDASGRLRLRVAFHQGRTQVGDGGFLGRAANTVCHLRDSDELRRALERHPSADLAVILSAQLFDDVIEHEYRDLRRHMFRQVSVHANDVVTKAWISVPDAVDPPGQARSGGSPPRIRPIPPGPILNIDEY